MTASPSSAHANKLLGKRVLGGGGGTIARLVADETVCPLALGAAGHPVGRVGRTVEVTDNGRGLGGQPGDKTHGHGLIGMRERVGMYGGEFSAASLPGPGFQVSATFPLAEAQVSA